MVPAPGRWKVLGGGEDGGYWDGSIRIYISYARDLSNSLIPPKSYLEQAPGYRIAAHPAAAGAGRSPALGVGNPGEFADAWRIDDTSAQAGVTWMIPVTPRNPSSP